MFVWNLRTAVRKQYFTIIRHQIGLDILSTAEIGIINWTFFLLLCKVPDFKGLYDLYMPCQGECSISVCGALGRGSGGNTPVDPGRETRICLSCDANGRWDLEQNCIVVPPESCNERSSLCVGGLICAIPPVQFDHCIRSITELA